MNNGITYYKKSSPFSGDTTKNCALTAQEMDNNFFVLEGRDIQSITIMDNKKIVLTLVNGETISTQDAFEDFITSVEFNENESILKIQQNNGIVSEFDLSGFATIKDLKKTFEELAKETGLKHIAVNDTLEGNALKSKPIGISRSYKTGQFKPVDFISENETCDGCCKHKDEKPITGTRVISSVKVSPYGLLYNYKTVCKIARLLQDVNSPWHLPSKDEWDDMLNAIEPHDCDKNHSATKANQQLGKWAGKLLKSRDFWKEAFSDKNCDCCIEDTDDFDDFEFGCDCKPSHKPLKPNKCHPSHCGDFENIEFAKNPDYFRGVDKYGFGVLPAGYADDGENINFFGERASFWTATNIQQTNVCTKRFEYDKTTVHQGITPAQEYMSIRLVKNYNGENYSEIEEILGTEYPAMLMPSIKNGSSIWMGINLRFEDKQCRGILPNKGNEMTNEIMYFIDEWDGYKWHRNMLKEGDSVVVKNAPGNRLDVEYRIIDGKLVDVTKEIHDIVIEDIQPSFDELNEKVENEAKERQEADEKLREEIKDNVNTFNELLSTETASREKRDEELQEAIDTEYNNRKEAVDAVRTEIQEEVVRRSEEDKKLYDYIDGEISLTKDREEVLRSEIQQEVDKRGKDVQGLYAEIAKETSARTDRDNQLQGDIDEVHTRIGNIRDELYKYIDNEVDNSKKRDNALQDQIDGANINLSEISSKLSDETKERQEADEEIQKQLINKGSFDGDNGQIILGNENDGEAIVIKLNLNMGTF